MDSEYTLVYLKSDDDFSLRLWPSMKARISAMMEEFDPSLPRERIVSFIQARWIQSPTLIGIWALIDSNQLGNGHLPEISGHMVAWVDLYWGQPYILVFQVKNDPGLFDLMYTEPLADWITYLNTMYEQAGSPLRIPMSVKFRTERDEEFMRFLRPRARKVETIIELSLEGLFDNKSVKQ